jgi:uncharacterized protein
MKKLKDFHHYKGSDLTKFEKVERKVFELNLQSKILDEQREDSKIFEFIHLAGTLQIGKLLADKRGLDVDLASSCIILHDIYAIINGKYKDHARLGAQIAEKILKEIGGFSSEEIGLIKKAVYHHSEKEIHSDNPYIELVKDADVFECSLYKNAEGFYSLHKPVSIFKAYVERIKLVRKELGLKVDSVFR